MSMAYILSLNFDTNLTRLWGDGKGLCAVGRQVVRKQALSVCSNGGNEGCWKYRLCDRADNRDLSLGLFPLGTRVRLFEFSYSSSTLSCCCILVIRLLTICAYNIFIYLIIHVKWTICSINHIEVTSQV